MSSRNPRPTVDELFELLKRTSLPTVLVEGKNDIIFYRSVEEDLRDIGIDMLPAGNKDSVLELRRRLMEQDLRVPIAFVVDNDLWVHTGLPEEVCTPDIVTTEGYSIENDLFVDGDLMSLLTVDEKAGFIAEIDRFSHWYALAIRRHLTDAKSQFRAHPGKVLDDGEFYNSSVELAENEEYPNELLDVITSDFSRYLRGKSLFALLHRQLSRDGRDVKFSEKQLMAFGASRKGDNFQRIRTLIRTAVSGSQSAE